MSAHTPGPWVVESDTRKPTHSIQTSRTAALKKKAGFALPLAWVSRHHDESAANARLIAAAPDLLKALERVAEHLSVIYGQNDGLVLTCFAAIAKARGGK